MKRVDQAIRHLKRDADDFVDAFLLDTAAIGEREERQLRKVRDKLNEFVDHHWG